MNTATHILRGLTDRQLALFWTKVDKTGPGGCWLWTGALHAKGYGTWTVGRGAGRSTSVRPHRVAWHLLRGEIPDGLVIDHVCQVRNCVNPDHLDVVPHARNLSRIPHAEVPTPMARVVAALLATRNPGEMADWWRHWLEADGYGRRRMERQALREATGSETFKGSATRESA